MNAGNTNESRERNAVERPDQHAEQSGRYGYRLRSRLSLTIPAFINAPGFYTL